MSRRGEGWGVGGGEGEGGGGEGVMMALFLLPTVPRKWNGSPGGRALKILYDRGTQNGIWMDPKGAGPSKFCTTIGHPKWYMDPKRAGPSKSYKTGGTQNGTRSQGVPCP